MKQLSLPFFLLLYLFFGFQLSSYAVIVNSLQAGAWNNTAIWSTGSVPSVNDDVNINHNVFVPVGGPFSCQSLKLNASGVSFTIQTGASLTIKNDLRSTSPTASFTNNGTLTIGGSNHQDIFGYTNGINSFTNFNGTLTPQNIRAATYSNLGLIGTSSKIAAGNLTVTNNLTVDTGVIFDLGVFGTSFIVNNASGSGTLKFNSGPDKVFSVGSMNISNIDMSSSGTRDTLKITNLSFTVNSLNATPISNVKLVGPSKTLPGVTFPNLYVACTTNVSSTVIVLGDLFINGSGAVNQGSSPIFVKGDFVNFGSYTSSSGGINLDGTTPQFIGGNPTNFPFLNILNFSDTVRCTTSVFGNVNISNDAVLDLGNVNSQFHSFGNVSGTGTLALTANFGNVAALPVGNYTGFLSPNQSTVYYYGNANFDINDASFPAGGVYHNLILGPGGMRQNINPLYIDGTLTIFNGATLDALNDIYSKHIDNYGALIYNNTGGSIKNC